MPLSFGVTVLPDPPYQRMIELFQLAERLGFHYAWTYDSHVLWQESMPTLAVAAMQTERIKLGHMVTNPGTRDPTVVASMYATLHDISDGRMVMGIGRGDSARRYINQQPVRVGRFDASSPDIPPKPIHWCILRAERGRQVMQMSVDIDDPHTVGRMHWAQGKLPFPMGAKDEACW